MLLFQDSCDDVINMNTIILKRDVQQLTEIDGVLNMIQNECLFLSMMFKYIPPPQSQQSSLKVYKSPGIHDYTSSRLVRVIHYRGSSYPNSC